MLLENYSDIDIIESELINDYINNDYINNDYNEQNNVKNIINFTFDNLNNLIISFNLSKKIVKNIRKNTNIQLDFKLSKELYLSILEGFK